MLQISDSELEAVRRDVLQRTVDCMRADGIPFVGRNCYTTTHLNNLQSTFLLHSANLHDLDLVWLIYRCSVCWPHAYLGRSASFGIQLSLWRP
jgi:hypothetical protein